MGNIHFSIEQFEKLKNNNVDSKTALLLKSFDPNREEKPKASKRVNDSRKTSNNIDSHLSTIGVKKISDEEWQKIKENANRIGDRLTYKELLENRRKHDELIRKYGVNNKSKKKGSKAGHRYTFTSGPGKKKTKYIEIKRKPKTQAQKSSKPLYDTYGKDYYDFAGEYEARSISFGYGRKKSKEWNGPILHGRITNNHNNRYPSQVQKQLRDLIRKQNYGR